MTFPFRPRPNNFAATCSVCHNPVAPDAGFYATNPVIGRRAFWCKDHVPTTAPWTTTPTIQDPDPMPDGTPDFTPRPMTPPPPSLPDVAPDAALIEQAVTRIAKMTADHFLNNVPSLVRSELEKLTARELVVKIGASPKITVKHSHRSLPVILQAVTSGASPFLVGPAGSGKTTLAEQVATVLKLKFYMAARVTSEFKLIGFITATGKVVRTQFREAYENGGVFLFDEVDASDPDALTAFNAALANGWGDFPDGMVKRHPNFYAVAAGNTYGRGADRQYVGRNQLDAATLDRFQVFDIDYDEALELQLAGDTAWVKYVQSVRRAIDTEKIRHIVSPRASIQGAKMLAAGMDRAVVESSCVWKGLPADARQRAEFRMISQQGN